ncbi:calmodulin-like protein 3 isoform X2 [Amaranthus tricolor]|uniref:calmodulin-like protein 3 isoform X2 n=1 Tax=Amaranthus tricolor TaxID=29722 RepID=UPI00258C48FE|nr:calmodulin-like protein 3 isoform X2 [Amaranthus tricolor]XP_057537615.1 calmodulin-like protein 3 isoform X2 [Amaranthus tricolor]XP_057537616.1 calmodulin-like protein 3 isoform X2 [Amaranthus tricolor]
MMFIPIIILVLSVLFIAGFFSLSFFNPTKKLLVHEKSLLSSSLKSNSNNNTNTMSMINKDDDLKQVFDTFDKNGDGFITREELKESLNNMGIIVPLKDVEEMVQNLDSNKDGLVDVDEFRELYEFLKGRLEEKKCGDDKDVDNFDDEDDLREAFSVFDDNKDGLITVKELGLVLSSLGLKEGNREEDCKEMIKKVDVDGDGMVNFDEFKMMMKTSGTKPSRLIVTT